MKVATVATAIDGPVLISASRRVSEKESTPTELKTSAMKKKMETEIILFEAVHCFVGAPTGIEDDGTNVFSNDVSSERHTHPIRTFKTFEVPALHNTQIFDQLTC